MKQTDPSIIVSHSYPVAKEIIWQALTELSHMKQWYFEIIEAFEPVVGFKTEFLISVEDRNYTHLWEVTEVIPNAKIGYVWRFKEHPGASLLTFELIDEGEQTTLNAIVDVMEDFPDGIPEFQRESCIGGWEYFLKQRLSEYVAED